MPKKATSVQKSVKRALNAQKVDWYTKRLRKFSCKAKSHTEKRVSTAQKAIGTQKSARISYAQKAE